jgi:hypothetical protein
MSETMLKQVRKDLGPYVFGSQMLLNPIADEAQGFKEEWLKYWPRSQFANLNKLMIVDPAFSKKRKNNDYTSMWVIGFGADLNWYVLRLCPRPAEPGRADAQRLRAASQVAAEEGRL